MTQEQKMILMEIKKEVLIKNNIHWLHERDRAEHQVKEGRIPITNTDLIEIIENYQSHPTIKSPLSN